MNRFFRRHKKTDVVDDPSGKRKHDIYAANTPQDVTDVRAKNQRHKKVTADKWNQ